MRSGKETVGSHRDRLFSHSTKPAPVISGGVTSACGRVKCRGTKDPLEIEEAGLRDKASTRMLQIELEEEEEGSQIPKSA